MTDFKERTDEEILARVETVKGDDWLVTKLGDLTGYLPWDKAKTFYKNGFVAKVDAGEVEWTPVPRDRDSIIGQIKEYMDFAWDKAKNCRGISAGRSMEHFSTWVWMAGDDLGDLECFDFYGKGNLVRICELYGIDHARWDDGIRVNSEDEL